MFTPTPLHPEALIARRKQNLKKEQEARKVARQAKKQHLIQQQSNAVTTKPANIPTRSHNTTTAVVATPVVQNTSSQSSSPKLLPIQANVVSSSSYHGHHVHYDKSIPYYQIVSAEFNYTIHHSRQQYGRGILSHHQINHSNQHGNGTTTTTTTTTTPAHLMIHTPEYNDQHALIIGNHKLMSRLHFTIEWNTQILHYQLMVGNKNSVDVNGNNYKASQIVILSNTEDSIIRVADTILTFIPFVPLSITSKAPRIQIPGAATATNFNTGGSSVNGNARPLNNAATNLANVGNSNSSNMHMNGNNKANIATTAGSNAVLSNRVKPTK